MKTALVLGSGGARGFAHVGVLKALEKANIHIDLIAGCSFGALIGAMYAQMPNIRFVEKKLNELTGSVEFNNLGLQYIKKRSIKSETFLKQFVKNVKDWMLLNLIAKRISLLKGERLYNVFKLLLADEDIRDTKIPFICNATDLISGHSHLFTQGNILDAVTASATIPGYFPPFKFANKLLVDGGVSDSLPVELARRQGADFIVAVDINPHIQPEDDFSCVLDVILRTNSITTNTLSASLGRDADVVISPPVKEYFWYEFDRKKEIIRAGEVAAQLKLEEIKSYLPTKPRRLLRRFFKKLNVNTFQPWLNKDEN